MMNKRGDSILKAYDFQDSLYNKICVCVCVCVSVLKLFDVG